VLRVLTVSVGALIVAGLAIMWGVVTEFRQARASGPVAVVPTYPFAVQAALLFTLGLFKIPHRVASLPWWGCIGLGLAVGAIGIALINVAGRNGRAR
jgi:hypothetical protein